MTNEVQKIVKLRSTLELIELDADFDRIVEECATELRDALFETSTLLAQFGNTPEGEALARFLHDKERISNRAEFRKHDMKKLNFAEYFKTHFDNLVIVQCEKGWGAAVPNTNYMTKSWGWDKETDKAIIRKERGREVPPEKDRLLPYDIYYTEQDENGNVKVQSGQRDRMGALNNKDVRNPRNVLNLIVEKLGNIKQLWLADARDTKDVKDLPPERLAGRQSREIGTPGSSVERTKINARLSNKDAIDDEELSTIKKEKLINRIFPRVSKIGPQLVKNIRSRQRRQGADEATLEWLEELSYDSDKLDELLKKYLQQYAKTLGYTTTAISNLIQAARGESNALAEILAYIRKEILSAAP